MTTAEKTMRTKLYQKEETSALLETDRTIGKFLDNNDPWSSFLLADRTIIRAELARRHANA